MKTLPSLITPPARLLFVALSLAAFFAKSGQLAAATVMNIEIDYMDSTAAGGHSHRPQPDEIAAVVQMFACHGITLNVVVDQAIPHSDVMWVNPANGKFFDYSGVTNSFAYLRFHYFGHAGLAGWHYCIFGHEYAADTSQKASGSSGLAQSPGANFVVTLGSFTSQIGTPFDRAATLAHEFGHNLGLGHGTVGNYQPNKPSIMSYFYQLSGVRSALIARGLTTTAASLFKEMDYSDGGMCVLNEAALDEPFGSGMVSVDWNCNNLISGVVSTSIDDGRSWCGTTNADRNILPDVNEWAVIHDTTQTMLRNERFQPVEVSCITAQDSKQYRTAFGPKGLQPALVSEPCVSANMFYLTPGATASGDGRCADPFTGLGLAQSAATDGSHLFCLPGTYTLDAGPLVLNKPMTIFCNIGSATIHPR